MFFSYMDIYMYDSNASVNFDFFILSYWDTKLIQ